MVTIQYTRQTIEQKGQDNRNNDRQNNNNNQCGGFDNCGRNKK